ncbi:hypothetical protein [Cohnella sp. GCM10012308]|uniref:hypothetical protein n=1 Tax=Cohnella sp. GCM10012308 TaxID=3317329 RepID=UPI00361B650B
MNLNLIEKEIKSKIRFYDGIHLTEFEGLSKRWNEISTIIYQEIFNYINDDQLCSEDSFPIRSKLSGNCYIDSISYIKSLNPQGVQIMFETRLTEYLPAGEEDYLGLEITIFANTIDGEFVVWGVDSSSI